MYFTDQATVTPLGIRYNENYFSCRRAIREQWYYRASIDGPWTVGIKIVQMQYDYFVLGGDGEICRMVTNPHMRGEKMEEYQSKLRDLKKLKYDNEIRKN